MFMQTNPITETGRLQSQAGESYVVADIGGINARFAIYTPGTS
jgi:hypothetical protein